MMELDIWEDYVIWRGMEKVVVAEGSKEETKLHREVR